MSKWKPWNKVGAAMGEWVLVRFRMVGGQTHIEDARIIPDEHGNPVYQLFDGGEFMAGVEPIEWMEIPK